VLCTVRLSRKLYPQHRRHGLDQLIERHGLVVTERHRALGDAQAICDFWQIARRDTDDARFAAVLRELTARPALPPHLDPEVLDDLPDACGVYLFYGENDLPLYVGKSKQIRSRVMAHFASDHSAAKEMSISSQVRRIEWLACAGEIEALLNEARLIKEMQPILNRQLRRNREYCTWQLVDHGFGHLQPRLVHARDLDLGRHDDLYGVFASIRSANDWMAALAKEHTLCLATLGLERTNAGHPCFARQLHRCRGACVGEESILQHGIRLIEALGRTRLVTWPFAGPATLAEGDALHLIDAWCYLGTARTAGDVEAVLAEGRPQFDRDTYRILVKHLDRMQPLPTAG
jgi:DNA polymerase-3 subunit epsilon